VSKNRCGGEVVQPAWAAVHCCSFARRPGAGWRRGGVGVTERKRLAALIFFVVTMPALAVGDELAARAPWDDEPVERLEPAPKAERTSQRYSWEQQHAKTDTKGGLAWTPRPFVFQPGPSVRFIDFAEGRDDNDGKTKGTAWKHHPWDGAATGRAVSCSGIHTYVFKRGVYYRGTLTARESGQPGNPIRLTSDSSWGKGEAVVCGSARITGGWKQGAEHPEIPDRESVWYTDLHFAPRNVWMTRGEEITRIPLARMPNWKVSDPEDVKKEHFAVLDAIEANRPDEAERLMREHIRAGRRAVQEQVEAGAFAPQWVL